MNKRCIILSQWNTLSQQTFQHCFNVVFWLIWRGNVGQLQTNIEKMLCISTLEFTKSCIVESTLCISMLIWIRLDNVETTLSFSTLNFTMLVNVEKTLWKWPFLKRTKKIISNGIQGIQSVHYYFIIFFTLLPMLRGICRRVLAKTRKFLKDREKYFISRT